MMCRGGSPFPPNKRLERTRHERASLLSCVGEPLKRSVRWLQFCEVVRMRSRKFMVGFLVVLLFCAANLYSYYRMPEYSSMDDGFVYFGWPFSVYAYGGFWGHPVTIWTGIIGNVFVALCAHRVIRRVFENVMTRRSLLAAKNPDREISGRFCAPNLVKLRD